MLARVFHGQTSLSLSHGFSCPSMLEIDKVEQQIRDSVGDGTTFNLYCLSLINLLTGRRKLKSFGHFADS